MKCHNCGHVSFVKSNFKCLSNGKAYCVRKCSEIYKTQQSWFNDKAREVGDKVE